MKFRLVVWSMLFWQKLVVFYQRAMGLLVLGHHRATWVVLAVLADNFMAAAEEFDAEPPIVANQIAPQLRDWHATVRRNAGLE